MYLSRVQIDVNNRQKTKGLTHLGAFHNWVERSFPTEIEAQRHNRHLWRIDQLGNKKYLLILSESTPDTEELERYGVSGTSIIKTYDKLLDSLQEQQVVQFRLTANPTYTSANPGKRQGRVVPHITIEQQRQWLVERAEKSGFELLMLKDREANNAHLTFDIVSREWPVLHRKTGRSVRLSQVTFEGRLRICDVAMFKKILIMGLGREKAFGMGMMTVIPEP